MSFLHSWIVILSLCIVARHAPGTLTFRTLSLGSSGIFFVGMARERCRAALPEAFQSLGLMLFIHSVGWEAGVLRGLAGQRYPPCRHRLLHGRLRLHSDGGLRAVFGLEPSGVAGVFAGALTFTPALAAALDGFFRKRAMPVTTAYGLADPA